MKYLLSLLFMMFIASPTLKAQSVPLCEHTPTCSSPLVHGKKMNKIPPKGQEGFMFDNVDTEAEALALLPVKIIDRTCEYTEGDITYQINWNSHTGFKIYSIDQSNYNPYFSVSYPSTLNGLIAWQDCEDAGGEVNID